jgi:trans-aconitate 2-methyltransferase
VKYLFGDTDLAARRLEIVADVFAESTRAFVADAAIGPTRLALDLGCGPGCCTHLLAKLVECDQCVGLDKSERFISLARKTETDRVSFRLHDVIEVPFPVGPADLIFCRFLLTHLTEPRTVVTNWGTQLRPGGLLLMEETEWIEADNPAFATYLNIVEAMLEHQSNKLYVGPVLDSLECAEIVTKRMSRVYRFRVANKDAATMFFMNIRTWGNNPFVRTNYSAELIGELENNLHAITKTPGDESEIEWGLRQIVFERV